MSFDRSIVRTNQNHIKIRTDSTSTPESSYMPGGLLNIVSYGNQNVFIHGNPSKTHFKTSYVKHTNFGLQKFRVDFDGSRTLRMDEETTFDFKIPRYAELLMDTYISVSMPHIWSPTIPPTAESIPMTAEQTIDPTADPSVESTRWRPYEFKWIKDLGTQMIKEIEISVGSQVIQHYTGNYLHNVVLRDFGVSKRKLYDEMTGNTTEMNDPANAAERTDQYPTAYSGDGTPCEPSIRGRKLYIPINSWFTLSSKMAFPLVSLQYNELHIKVTFRPVRELFSIRNVVDTSYDIREPTPYVQAVKGVAAHHFNRFLHTPPGVDILNTAYPSDRTDWATDIHLISTYGFLSEDEVAVFARDEQTYLIKEAYEQTFYNVVGSKTLEIVTGGMVSSWMWFLRRSDANLRNQWTNYTNWPYLYQPVDLIVAPLYDVNGGLPGCYSNGNDSLKYGLGPGIDASILIDGQTYQEYQNGSYITGDYKPNNFKSILDKCAILFDGKYRENEMTGDVYSYIDKYTRTRGYADNGLYCYNFCLDTSPYSFQPSGAVNLSTFNTIGLEIVTAVPPMSPNRTYTQVCDEDTGLVIGDNVTQAWKLYEYMYDLVFMEERYNILKFISGNASLMYAR